MAKDAPNQSHLDAVTSLGCLACLNMDGIHTPADAHHIRAGEGMSQRASDFLTIPLCRQHHQDGGHGTAIHAGQRTWEGLFGTERELLAQTLYCLQAGRAVPFNLPFSAHPVRTTGSSSPKGGGLPI